MGRHYSLAGIVFSKAPAILPGANFSQEFSGGRRS
jgi:hypothetical protein